MNTSRLDKESIVMPDPNFPVWAFYYEKQDDGELFPTHWHEDLEIFTVASGYVDVLCEGKTYRANTGDTFLLNPNEYHSSVYASCNLKLYCNIFNVRLLHSSVNDSCNQNYVLPILKNKMFLPNYFPGDTYLFNSTMKIADEIKDKKNGYELRVKATLMTILSHIVCEYNDKLEFNKALTINTVNHKRVQDVIKYIETHYENNITIDEIANHLFLNKFYVCKIFKEFTDVSIIHYLNMCRVNKAIELLISTEKSITEIAILTGFNEINYFSRIFKLYAKQSPSQVKKNSKKFRVDSF